MDFGIGHYRHDKRVMTRHDALENSLRASGRHRSRVASKSPMAGGRGKEHLKGLPSFINLTGGRTFRVANAQRTSGIAGAELVYASSKPLKPTTVKGETVRPRVIDFDVDTRFTTEEAARAAWDPFMNHSNIRQCEVSAPTKTRDQYAEG